MYVRFQLFVQNEIDYRKTDLFESYLSIFNLFVDIRIDSVPFDSSLLFVILLFKERLEKSSKNLNGEFRLGILFIPRNWDYTFDIIENSNNNAPVHK